MSLIIGLSSFSMATVPAQAAVSEHKLIDDETDTFVKDALDRIEGQLEGIRAGNSEQPLDYRVYTYIYDSKKSAKETADSIAERYGRDKVPVVFIFNKRDNSFFFLEDMKTAPYFSSAYAANMADRVLGEGLNEKKLGEFLYRLDSVLYMTIDGDFGYVGSMGSNKEAEKYSEVRYMSVGKLKHKEEKQELPDTKKQEGKSTLPIAIAFFLAAGSIFFIVMRKRRNGRR